MGCSKGYGPSTTINTGSSPTLMARVVTSRNELESYALEWNELLSSSKANTIFLTWEWISTWLDVVYPDAALFIIVVETKSGELVAIAPFYRTTMALLGHVKYACLRVIGDCESGGEYQDIIVRDEFMVEALELIGIILKKACKQWDCIWLPNVADWTGASKRIESMYIPCRIFSTNLIKQFSIINLPASHVQYLKTLTKKFRYNIRRYKKTLFKRGKLECVRYEEGESLASWLIMLFDLHRRRWKSVGQEGSFVRRPFMTEFYMRFAPLAFKRGWLRLYSLRVNGRTVAMRYGYAYGSTLYGLQGGLDPSIKGCGHVLLDMILAASIEEGLTAYDFLSEVVDYKQRWGAQIKMGRGIFLGRRSLKTRLLFWPGFWPSGRYIDQGKPANLGRSHD
jgi:CelD/BcsL family acetyltransferase involved in cellulose biosynthesis